MAKKLIFQTISLGSEPITPEAGQLTEWVSAQRGRQADITSFLLEKGLFPQQEASVDLPCAGGKFYQERWRESISGQENGYITGELGIRTDYVVEDTVRIREISGISRGALPAPHRLGFNDRYYGDEEEAVAALYHQYKHLFRAMRDAGIVGHVLHCTEAVPGELEALAGKKVFFYLESPDVESMATLLEHQKVLAVRKDDFPLLVGHSEEYEINQVLIIDPDADALREALRSFDPDYIQVGGYCTGDNPGYWKSLVDSAILSL
jgi:hypothetical protein